MDPSLNKKSNSTGKKTVPRRFITEKIEEIFRIAPSDRHPSGKMTLFLKGLFRSKKRNLLISLFGLAVFLVGGWTHVFQNLIGPRSVDRISINFKSSFETFGSVIATPLLSDLDQDGSAEVVFADRLGNVFAIDDQGEIIYRFSMGKGVVASLTGIDADSKPPFEVLVVSEEGDFFVLNHKGNYLYQSRKEFFREKIFAKPAYLPEKNLIFLAGREGSVWAVHSQYGEVVWVNDYSPLKGNQIFSSPLVLLSDSSRGVDQSNKVLVDLVLVLSENGRLVAFKKDNGFLAWELDLQDRFKASMVSGYFLGEKYGDLLVLASLKGNIYLISKFGQIIKKFNLKTPVISTPAKGWIIPEQLGLKDRLGHHLVTFVTEDGKVYVAKFSSKGDRLRLSSSFSQSDSPVQVVVKKILHLVSSTFISSPVLVDFNRDKIDDILLISRSGNVYLVNGKSLKIMNPPFELNYQVTATPLVADLSGDGKLEIVVAGENGQLDVLGLEYFPDLVFPRNIVLYREFLKGPLNQN